MIRILGSPRRLCDGITRREMLRIGAVGSTALSLPNLLRWRSAQAAGSSGGSSPRAKRIILLHLYGAAPQHELYDPKPQAPAEIRGKFKAIPTSVPGTHICEHLPRLASIADRVTFVRSMSHPYNIHSVAYSLTGVDHVDVPMELNPVDGRHWPFFGSVLEYLNRRKQSPAAHRDVPFQMALPFLFSSRCAEFDRAGPFGGFLGRTYDPVWTEFDGEATRTVKRWRGNSDRQVADPYLGITPESRLTVSQAARLPEEITLDRLSRRRTLLEQLDEGRRRLEATAATRSMDHFREMAWSLIASPQLRRALDLSQEPMSLRERYGMTLFGQSALAARRLLEAGATLVTVIWDEIGTANSAWDTHFNHFERLEGELLPGLDHALSALILDLEQRGMLDDTLVMCLTEHGRTPKLHPKPRGVGREHWSHAYCNLLAGGGIARGAVIGRTDSQGGYVEANPIDPKDILCTMYHLMGIDPHTTIPDRLNRPLPLVSRGRIVHEMLA